MCCNSSRLYLELGIVVNKRMYELHYISYNVFRKVEDDLINRLSVSNN